MRRVGLGPLLAHEQPLALVLHQDLGVGSKKPSGGSAAESSAPVASAASAALAPEPSSAGFAEELTNSSMPLS